MIPKAAIQMSDKDLGYYHEYTIARHPSETDERMMAGFQIKGW